MSTASIENLKHKMLALNPDVRMQLAHTLALSLEGLSCDATETVLPFIG